MSVPLFKNFGKSAKDLFKKKYDFDNQIKTMNKNGKGCTLESGVVCNKGGDVRGYVKTTWLCKNGSGNGEAELHTDASNESKVQYKFTNLLNGLTVSPAVTSKDKAYKRAAGTLDLEYIQSNVAASAQLKSDSEVHKLETSLTVANDGIAVGGSAVADLTNGAKLAEFNFGAQYTAKDFQTAVFTENNHDVLNASYHLKVDNSLNVGASVRFDMNKNVRTATIGCERRIDELTSLKSKIDISSANPSSTVVSVAMEHRLPNPALLLSVASSFKTGGGKCCETAEHGIGITLGDF